MYACLVTSLDYFDLQLSCLPVHLVPEEEGVSEAAPATPPAHPAQPLLRPQLAGALRQLPAVDKTTRMTKIDHLIDACASLHLVLNLIIG